MVQAISQLSIQLFVIERMSEAHSATRWQAFTVLVQLCGPSDNETETGAALLIKNGVGRSFDFECVSIAFKWVR